MTLCTNCGREIPCGCPNPSRAEVKLSTLFGLVCERCDAYNDSDRSVCIACGVSLTGESPAAEPPAVEAPVAVAPPPRVQPAVAPPIALPPAAEPRPPPPVAVAAQPQAPLQLIPTVLPAPLPLTEVIKKATVACTR